MGANPSPTLHIGAAIAWDIESDGVASRRDELAIAHRVEGMPKGFSAFVHRPRPSAYSYVVEQEGKQIERSEDCYESKADALAGLESWLHAWLARTP